MINRVLIRIKTIQLLYAWNSNRKNSAASVQQELEQSINDTYDLYHWLLQLCVDITDYAVKRIEIGLNKMRPTAEERNPNKRFINNKFAKQLAQNQALQAYAQEHGISWSDKSDLLKELYEQITASDVYKEYLALEAPSYDDEKNLWRKLFKRVISHSELLESELEEMNLYWNDDYEIVFSFVDKTIKRFTAEAKEQQALLPMYQDENDRGFAGELMGYIIKNQDDYINLIRESAKNWELDRIADMDIVIMTAAIAELTHFPTIPVSVTLNEYIEISKFYSTEKSCTFINGVLDNICNKLRSEGKLLKVGALVQNNK